MPSLTVMNIESILDKDKFEDSEKFKVEKQTSVKNHMKGSETLETTKTFVEKIGEQSIEDKTFSIYNIEMSSSKKEEPIYIYEEDLKKWERGYQEIENFKVWIDNQYSRLCIFAPRRTSTTFKARLKKAERMECDYLEFNFSKITELEHLDSEWGVWEDSRGIIRRKAKFGKDIDRALESYDDITTFYLDYKYNSQIIHLILSKRACVSSKENKVDNIDLYRIYQEIKDTLITNK